MLQKLLIRVNLVLAILLSAATFSVSAAFPCDKDCGTFGQQYRTMTDGCLCFDDCFTVVCNNGYYGCAVQGGTWTNNESCFDFVPCHFIPE